MSLRTARAVSTKDGSRRAPSSWFFRSLTGVRHACVYYPGWLWWSVRRLPRWQQALLTVTFLALGAVTLYYAIEYRSRERQKNAVANEWKTFDLRAGMLDQGGMAASLDKIAALKPDDPLIRKRRASLERGEGDPDDPVMINYWMIRYVSDARIPDAAREARKRLESRADDWQAHCVLADEAWLLASTPRPEIVAFGVLAYEGWRQLWKDEAIRHLKLLPSPSASQQPLSMGGLKYGLSLHRALQVDDRSLRSARHDGIVGFLKNPEITRQPHGAQLLFLEMYLDAFEDIDSFEDLPSVWASSDKMAQNLFEDQSMSTMMLAQLGLLQQKQFAVLAQVVRKRHWTAEKAEPWARILLDRGADIWQKVRAQDPTIPEGYLGGADVELSRGRPGLALQLIREGEEACSDKLRMVNAQYQVLIKVKSNEECLARVEEFAKRYPEQELVWLMLKDRAFAAARPDRALEISRQAKERFPNSLWPFLVEARVHLDQERDKRALESLAKCKEFLIVDQEVTELYVRAYAMAGLSHLIRPLFDRLAAEATDPGKACPALRAALDAGYAEDVAAASRALAKRFPDYHKNLLLIVGESQLAIAEPKTEDSGWNVDAARIGARALERIHEEDPNDLHVVKLLAWLQVKGLKSPDAASRTAEPLREAHRAGRLPPDMFDTLAAVELANMHYDEARTLLLSSLEKRPTAGQFAHQGAASEYVHLALASYYLKMPGKARESLAMAASLPRSPRVSQEFKQASTLIDGKKP